MIECVFFDIWPKKELRQTILEKLESLLKWRWTMGPVNRNKEDKELKKKGCQ